jgi:ABC-type polysaccharide/polyol phosphate export permease
MKYSLGYLFDLTLTITSKEIKVRYKNNIFGYLWSLANPLCFAFIYYIAFKMVMRVPIENYTLFLISGIFPWQWFANSVNMGMTGYIANAQVIKRLLSKVYYSLGYRANGMLSFYIRYTCHYRISFNLWHDSLMDLDSRDNSDRDRTRDIYFWSNIAICINKYFFQGY